MTNNILNIHKLKWYILLVCLPLIAGALQVHLPSLWGGFIGDSAVYYAMSDSLAHDGDLQYTQQDLARITREWPGGPQGILLTADKNDPTRIHYAKPLLYSLAGAPFVRFFRANGLLFFNALCFAFLVFLGCLAFPEWEEKRPLEICLWSLVFWALTAVPAYIFSLTPDLFNGTLVMAGLIPWVRHSTSRHPLRMLVLSAFILGIAAASRPPNGLFLLLPLWSLLFPTLKTSLKQRIVTFLVVITVFVLGVTSVYGLSYLLTGQGFAYSGFRKRIVGHFPLESSEYTFLNTGNLMSTESTKFVFHWDTLRHNLRYFFVGRFAGLIPYFFPAFVSLVAIFPTGGKRQVRIPVLLVVTGLLFFHIVYIPSNWHGGSCAVGNRYLISWLPAFMLLLRRPPNRKILLVTAAFTAVFTGAVTLSPATALINYRDIPKRTIMQVFPMEITLLESWPVDDLKHRRVDYVDYFLYFADDNQFGQEEGGYWVRGRSRADCVMRCWKPTQKVMLTIRNGARSANLYGCVGNAEFSRKAGPGELINLELKPGPPVNAYNLAGNVSYCYPVRIGTSSGFIPRYLDTQSTDHRFLGCFIKIGLES
ncbi:hypothetical protein K8T06_11220 [bacterium]|nr:hypothetical protein [bacterium]